MTQSAVPQIAPVIFQYDMASPYDPNLSVRVVRQTFPNGRFVEFQYDSNGNLTGVTPPQKPVYLFDFDAMDLLST